jgi:hypothetical protein
MSIKDNLKKFKKMLAIIYRAVILFEAVRGTASTKKIA